MGTSMRPLKNLITPVMSAILLIIILAMIYTLPLPPNGPRGPLALAALRRTLTDSNLFASGIQFSIVFFLELAILYSILHNRGPEVFVFSHVRLVGSVFLLAATNLAYFKLALFLRPVRGLPIHLLYGVLTLTGWAVFRAFQALILAALSRLSSEPILKDLKRTGHKESPCNDKLIRLFAGGVFLLYLLLPTLILTAPCPLWCQYTLCGFWAILAFKHILSFDFVYVEA